MGKGNYTGGSTLIKPGSSLLSGYSKRKKRNRVKQTDRMLQDNYLRNLISAELNGTDVPNPPQKIREDLEEFIEKAGGAIEWARSQPDYKRKRELKLKQIEDKVKNNKV